MKIQSIKVQHLQIPMRIRFAQSNHATRTSNAVIITITSRQGTVGYGESCPRTYVTGETVDSVANDIRSLNEQLLALDFQTIEDIRGLITSVVEGKIGLAASCALELALLDAWGKENHTPLINAFKSQLKPFVDYSGVVPFGNLTKMEPLLSQFAFQSVKLKINTDLEDSLQRIDHLKGIYGHDIDLRVDANGAFEYQQVIEQVPVLMEAGIKSFEQLFPKGKEEDMAQITALFGEQVTIMADESLCALKDAQYLAENQMCNGFNLKISKNGGLFNTLRMIELAEKYGISYQLGAHFGETSILTAAGLLLANLAAHIQYREGGLGTILLENDLVQESLKIGRDALINSEKVATKNGLGLDVEPGFLKNSSSASAKQQVELAYYFTNPQHSLKNMFWY